MPIPKLSKELLKYVSDKHAFASLFWPDKQVFKIQS